MTTIKIPLSVDQRASECLEEYGTYHRLPDLVLNDRCLIGYVLKTIQDMLPTAQVDTYNSNEWTAEDLSSLEVHVTTVQSEARWYWKVEAQASIDTGTCRYSIEVHSTKCDTFAIIGTVDRLSTLLAILCSEVDFSFVGNKDRKVEDTFMLIKGKGAGIIRGLNVWEVQEAATETYKKVGGVLNLRDYIADLRQAIGGGVLNGKPEMRFTGEGGALNYHISLQMYDSHKDRPWNTYLGTADNIIAALIITCGGVEYTDKIGPTFPQDGAVDVHALEDAATSAYLAAKVEGNCLPICDYIADTFRVMGYGAVVVRNYRIEVRESGSTTTRYKITALNKDYGIVNFDVYYGDDILLGRVTTVTAVIAIVCTSLSFRTTISQDT